MLLGLGGEGKGKSISWGLVSNKLLWRGVISFLFTDTQGRLSGGSSRASSEASLALPVATVVSSIDRYVTGRFSVLDGEDGMKEGLKIMHDIHIVFGAHSDVASGMSDGKKYLDQPHRRHETRDNKAAASKVYKETLVRKPSAAENSQCEMLH